MVLYQIIQNSKQAQTSMNIAFVYDNELLFKQTCLRGSSILNLSIT